jgi:hypothetical protein
MSVIERHLAGAHVSVPLKTPRSRQVGIPEAGYHPQFPVISFYKRGKSTEKLPPRLERAKRFAVLSSLTPVARVLRLLFSVDSFLLW